MLLWEVVLLPRTAVWVIRDELAFVHPLGEGMATVPEAAKETLRSEEELDTSHLLVYRCEVSGFEMVEEFVVGRDEIPELLEGALRYAF
jgi:hypothetical protein